MMRVNGVRPSPAVLYSPTASLIFFIPVTSMFLLQRGRVATL